LTNGDTEGGDPLSDDINLKESILWLILLNEMLDII
jgi:hypothetical protein